MSNKTIQINPELFSFGGSAKNTTCKKEKKEKPKMMVRPNTLKKELLSKIKDYQKKNEIKAKSENNKYSDQLLNDNNYISNDKINREFDNEFNKSLGFLQELSKKRDKEKREKREKRRQDRVERNHNKTLKSYENNNYSNINVNLELPEEFNIETTSYKNTIQPPYGCLKNGYKPTYRTWKRETQKIYPSYNSHEKLDIENYTENHDLNERMEMLKNVRREYRDNNSYISRTEQPSREEIRHMPRSELPRSELPKVEMHKSEMPRSKLPRSEIPIIEQSKPEIPIIEESKSEIFEQEKKPFKLDPLNANSNKKDINILKRRIKTLKYRLGKHDNKVSIFIKNRDTRKQVRQEHTKLKKMSIIDIKNYLRQHNLIKAGSNAPNDVIREIYEQTILSGEINNVSKENLLHNYFNT